MKIIYVHHALREKGNPPTQEDDISKIGEKDAEVVSQILQEGNKSGLNLKAIYTSPFFRCKKTAKIINQHLSLPIYTDDRLNEMGSFQGETWIDLQTRVREAIKDIIYSYDDNDAVICVTSGINVISFISLALRQQPSKDYPYIGIPSCSPMIFEIKKEYFI